MKEIDRFVSKLDFDQLLEKIKDWGKTLGRTSMRPVLSLYYVLKSPDTPLSDKLLVVSALSYLILPVDLISARRFPVLGWIDEITAVTIAYKKVKKYITPEIESEVDNILEKWFPELKYEILL
jgi:hypothetical protein